MCILSVMYVTFQVSGYEHITFDGLLLEGKSNFSCCYIYIYNRLWLSFSDRYTIRYMDGEKHSENKFKA